MTRYRPAPQHVIISTFHPLDLFPFPFITGFRHSTCIALLRKIWDNRQCDIAWKNLTRPICFPEYLLPCLVLWKEKLIHLWKMDSLMELFNILPYFLLRLQAIFFLFFILLLLVSLSHWILIFVHRVIMLFGIRFITREDCNIFINFSKNVAVLTCYIYIYIISILHI